MSEKYSKTRFKVISILFPAVSHLKFKKKGIYVDKTILSITKIWIFLS